MVLDYVGGGELFFWLRKEKRFSENRCRLYAAEIGLALDTMHKEHIVYRDLKPENVCVVNSGDATSSADSETDLPEVALIDFGHARPVPDGSCVDDDVWEASSSARGASQVRYPQNIIAGEAGSDSYASPEVLQESTFGTTSDTWSFGIMMYAMLSGALPWPEGRQHDFLLDQVEIDACLDDHLSHNLLRPVVVDLLRKCLVIDPQKRSRPDQLLTHEVWDELFEADMTQQEADVGSARRGTSPYPVFWDMDQAGGQEPLPDYKQQAGVFQKKDVTKLRGNFMMSKVRRGLNKLRSRK